jgi:hypothetical protein
MNTLGGAFRKKMINKMFELDAEVHETSSDSSHETKKFKRKIKL